MLAPMMGELRALGAVTRKEWLYFVRYPSWWVAMLVWPVIFPFLYILSARALAGPDGSGLALFTQRTGVADYQGFIVIGTTFWMWQNVVLWGIGFALRSEQMRGTLESNWLTPAWRFSFLIGPSLVNLLNMLAFLAVGAIEFGLIFGVRFHGNPLLVLLVALASLATVYGLGMAFASLVINAKEAQNFVYLARGLIMIFCGVTFPISILPGWMQGIAGWIPQTYMIRAMRAAALHNASLGELGPDLLVLAGFGAFWLAAGWLAFTWMEQRARRTGSIGHY
jgi:ABC-2 type transport system permease protein